METIPEILAHCVRSYGDRIAVRSCGGSGAAEYTHRQVGWMAAGAAGRLAARGACKGAPIALLCENRPEWAIAYFAVHLAGGVLVPIDASLTGGEARGIIRRSGAKLVIVSRPLLDLVGGEGPDVVTLEDLLAEIGDADGGESSAPAVEVQGDDVAVISFSSGTTGDSKGIVLTHRNIATNAVVGGRRLGIGPEDRMVSILPLNHLFEQTCGLLAAMVCGASVTYPGTLNPRTIVDAMRKSRATIALVVPAMARLFHKRILSAAESGGPWRRRAFGAARRISRACRRLGIPAERTLFRGVHRAFGGEMRFFVSGGAALEPDLAAFFLDLGVPVLQGYGLSETAPVVSCNTLDEHVVGSVGRPLPGVEVKIDHAAGGGDGTGEVIVRGANVMAGYFQDQAATDEAFDDGWFRTGDLGRLDEDGYLYIVGRLKDVIVGASGKNVYPTEVEARIARSPHVREVCVLGIRAAGGADKGEQVAALVSPSDEALDGEYVGDCDELLRREVRKACIDLADYKRPRYFALWDGEFPRTTTMKIKKHEVRKRLDEVALTPL